jgi:hypothetical protein
VLIATSSPPVAREGAGAAGCGSGRAGAASGSGRVATGCGGGGGLVRFGRDLGIRDRLQAGGFGGSGFLGGAGLGQRGFLRDRGLALGDGVGDARQRRGLRIGGGDQRAQAFSLQVVLAADRLLGGDHCVGLQVHQRAFGGGVRLVGLLAQGDVVLHRVVAGGGVDALLAQGGAALVAQILGGQRGELGGLLGGGTGLGGFGGSLLLDHGGGCRRGRLFLLAAGGHAESQRQRDGPAEGRGGVMQRHGRGLAAGWATEIR